MECLTINAKVEGFKFPEKNVNVSLDLNHNSTKLCVLDYERLNDASFIF